MLELENRWSKPDESHSEQSKTERRKQLSARRKHWNHMRLQVKDRPRPDAPSLTQTVIVQMVYCKEHHAHQNEQQVEAHY